jgi:probable HAF family extracellular repeat protein
MQDLGAPGGSNSSAAAVSGEVVGGSVTSANSEDAFADNLAGPPGAVDLAAALGATNNFSDVTGVSINPVTGHTILVGSAEAASGGAIHAFAYDLNAATATDLSTLGGPNSFATAVSGGIVVGFSDLTGGLQDDAFAYDLNATAPAMQDLGTFGGPAANSIATAVSSNPVTGNIVVGSDTTASGVTHAFADNISAASPAMQDLGTLVGGTTSFAQAVDGDMVVGSATTASSETHAFAYNLGAVSPVMTDLGTLGGPNSSAMSVSGNLVVGSADVNGGTATTPPTTHGFADDLATSTGMQDLGTLGGANSAAAAVSGGNVVGYAQTASQTATGGQDAAAWSLPPSPAASLSASSGLSPAGGTVTVTDTVGSAPSGGAAPAAASHLSAARVLASPVSFAPTSGTVAFTDNGGLITGCSAVHVVAGAATCTFILQTPGGHNIVARFSGAGSLPPSTSPTFTEVASRTPCRTLAGCNLQGLGITGGNLNGVNLAGVNGNGTNLSGSNLANANLTRMNLNRANLNGTRFSGANLRGSNLNNATLTGATWNNTTCPDGTNSNAHGGTCIGHL